MTDPQPQSSRSRTGKTLWRSRSTVGTIAAVALVGIYSLVAPKIRESTGLPLPTLSAGMDGQVKVADGGSATAKQPAQTKTGQATDGTKQTPSTFSPKSKSGGSDSSKSEPAKRGPLASRMSPTKSASGTPTTTKSTVSRAENASKDETSDLLYGRLKEISPKRYVSISGLMYTPGSAEGHRLEHLRRHTEDQPNRPGKHGVFDGGMEGALKTIDNAYERAKKKQRTTVSKEDGRTIYTVDMGGRVGFVGGRNGGQNRNPMARRVKIVLDGNRVITAFPL